MFAHARRWLPLALLVVLSLGLPAASPLLAASAGIEPDGSPVSSVSRVGDQITFTGLPDESTQLDVQLLIDVPVRYQFTSSEQLFAGTNCTAITQFSASCAVTVNTFLTLDVAEGAFDVVDTVYVRGSRTGDSISILTGAGDDVVIVDSDGAATGPIGMVDASGTDELWLDDSQSPGGRTYTLVTDSITRTGSGAYFHNGAEFVRLFGGGSTDIVLVNATSATVTSLISTGAGSDTIQLGVTTLDPLDGVIFLDGEANTDFLTLKDTGTGANHSFSIGSNQITRAGFAGVTHSNVDSVRVEGGSGHDQWAVAGTMAATQLLGGDGVDSFTVADNLDALAAPLSIDGQGNVDQLDIDDRGNATPAEYTITGTNVYRQIGPPVTSIAYAAIEGLTLNTQDAASEIWIAGTIANTFVFAHGGNDLIKVGDGSVNSVAHTVNLFGGAGTDHVVIDDQTSVLGGGAYIITGTTFDRINGSFGLLQYAEVESLTLDAHEAGNEIGVNSTAAGVDYTINGGEGPDDMGFSFDLDTHLGNLLVRGHGGTDSFTVFDDVQATGNTYELRPGRIERIAQQSRPPMLYETVENITLVTGAGAESVFLFGTVPGTTTAIQTGDQTDSVSVVATGLGATGLAVLNGGPGSDGLYFADGGLGSSSNGSTITTPGRHNVNYSQFETAPIIPSTDVDGDGCLDSREIGLDRNFGGERSPFDPYDWFDVAGPDAPSPDGAIDLSDTLAVLARFGLLPGDDGYSWIYDREAVRPTMPWRPSLAGGLTQGIDLQDALLNLQSFGHSCV